MNGNGNLEEILIFPERMDINIRAGRLVDRLRNAKKANPKFPLVDDFSRHIVASRCLNPEQEKRFLDFLETTQTEIEKAFPPEKMPSRDFRYAKALLLTLGEIENSQHETAMEYVRTINDDEPPALFKLGTAQTQLDRLQLRRQWFRQNPEKAKNLGYDLNKEMADSYREEQKLKRLADYEHNLEMWKESEKQLPLWAKALSWAGRLSPITWIEAGMYRLYTEMRHKYFALHQYHNNVSDLMRSVKGLPENEGLSDIELFAKYKNDIEKKWDEAFDFADQFYPEQVRDTTKIIKNTWRFPAYPATEMWGGEGGVFPQSRINEAFKEGSTTKGYALAILAESMPIVQSILLGLGMGKAASPAIWFPGKTALGKIASANKVFPKSYAQAAKQGLWGIRTLFDKPIPVRSVNVLLGETVDKIREAASRVISAFPVLKNATSKTIEFLFKKHFWLQKESAALKEALDTFEMQCRAADIKTFERLKMLADALPPQERMLVSKLLEEGVPLTNVHISEQAKQSLKPFLDLAQEAQRIRSSLIKEAIIEGAEQRRSPMEIATRVYLQNGSGEVLSVVGDDLKNLDKAFKTIDDMRAFYTKITPEKIPFDLEKINIALKEQRSHHQRLIAQGMPADVIKIVEDNIKALNEAKALKEGITANFTKDIERLHAEKSALTSRLNALKAEKENLLKKAPKTLPRLTPNLKKAQAYINENKVFKTVGEPLQDAVQSEILRTGDQPLQNYVSLSPADLDFGYMQFRAGERAHPSGIKGADIKNLSETELRKIVPNLDRAIAMSKVYNPNLAHTVIAWRAPNGKLHILDGTHQSYAALLSGNKVDVKVLEGIDEAVAKRIAQEMNDVVVHNPARARSYNIIRKFIEEDGNIKKVANHFGLKEAEAVEYLYLGLAPQKIQDAVEAGLDRKTGALFGLAVVEGVPPHEVSNFFDTMTVKLPDMSVTQQQASVAALIADFKQGKPVDSLFGELKVFIDETVQQQKAFTKQKSLLNAQIRETAAKIRDTETLISGTADIQNKIVKKEAFPAGVPIRQVDLPDIGIEVIPQLKAPIGYVRHILTDEAKSLLKKLPKPEREYWNSILRWGSGFSNDALEVLGADIWHRVFVPGKEMIVPVNITRASMLKRLKVGDTVQFSVGKKKYSLRIREFADARDWGGIVFELPRDLPSREFMELCDTVMREISGRRINWVTDCRLFRDMGIRGAKGNIIPLRKGTIDEINRIFSVEYGLPLFKEGVKLFEDDIVAYFKKTAIPMQKQIAAAEFLTDIYDIGQREGWIKTVPPRAPIPQNFQLLSDGRLPNKVKIGDVLDVDGFLTKGEKLRVAIRSDIAPYVSRCLGVVDDVILKTRIKEPLLFLTKIYQKAMKEWKWQAIASPKWAGASMLDNVFRAFADGVDSIDLLPKVWQITKGVRHFDKTGSFSKLSPISILDKYGRVIMNGEELWKYMTQKGATAVTSFAATTVDNLIFATEKKIPMWQKVIGAPREFFRTFIKAGMKADEIGKIWVVLDGLKKGMNIEAAVDRAQRVIYNYADVPQAVEFLRRSGLAPFLIYPFKTFGYLSGVAYNRPQWLIPFVRQHHARRKKLLEHSTEMLVELLHKRGIVSRINPQTGQIEFLKGYSYLSPQDYFESLDFLTQGKFGLGDVLGQFGGPIPSIFYRLLTGIEPFGQRATSFGEYVPAFGLVEIPYWAHYLMRLAPLIQRLEATVKRAAQEGATEAALYFGAGIATGKAEPLIIIRAKIRDVEDAMRDLIRRARNPKLLMRPVERQRLEKEIKRLYKEREGLRKELLELGRHRWRLPVPK